MLILLAATALALLSGDRIDAVLIFSIVLGSGLFGFWREHASVAVARLLEQVQIQVEVRRSGRVTSVRPQDVVVGDVCGSAASPTGAFPDEPCSSAR